MEQPADKTAMGQTFRERRRLAGLTQAELGRLLGVSQSTVSRVERSLVDPSVGHRAWFDSAEPFPTPHIEPNETPRNMHHRKHRLYEKNA